MRAASAIVVALSAARTSSAARVLQGNDDGWAELYVRSFNDALNAAGHDVVLSCPADNKSGTGSLDIEPLPRLTACQYDSCAGSSAPVGSNQTNPRLNWVNAFPVTGVRYGIDTFGPQIWNNQKPELVVTGPNVGSNLYLQVPFSGTVGAACYAVKQGIPAVAFSGASDGNLPWNTSPPPARSLVYAELATKLTGALLSAGAPYLPKDVFLNVNFPKIEGACTSASSFKWILTRINPPGLFSTGDMERCGSKRLPTESDVIGKDGCYATISVGNANDKTTAGATEQAVVAGKLGSLLSCVS